MEAGAIFADYLNGLTKVRYYPLPSHIKFDFDGQILEGALWQDGKMLTLYFAPSDEPYDLLHIRDYYAEFILDSKEIFVDQDRLNNILNTAEIVSKMNVQDLTNKVSLPLPEGVVWVGKIVDHDEAINDLRDFRPKQPEIPTPRM